MIQKLKELEQIKAQQRMAEQVGGQASTAIISDLIESAVIETQVLKEQSRIHEMSVKCTVVEKMNFENNQEDIIRQNKLKYLKKINLMSEINHPLLVQYLGVSVVKKGRSLPVNKDGSEHKQNQEKPETCISLLAQANLIRFVSSRWKNEPKNKEDLLIRIVLCRQLIEAIAVIHEHQYSFFPENVEDVILLTSKNHLKIASHKLKSWRDTTQKEVQQIRAKQSTKLKTSALANRSIKYHAPEFIFKNTTIKDIRCNDVWKVGLMAFGLLTGEDYSKEVLGLQNVEEQKANNYKIITDDKLSKLKKICKNTLITELLKTLNFVPAERKSLSELLKDFLEIEAQLNQKFTPKTVKQSKKKYIQKQEQNTVKFMLQLKSTEQILNQDNKKRLVDYFKTVQHRSLKKFQPLLRASQSNFSSRCFYEAAIQKKHLLVVIQEKKQKKKIICYSQQTFDLQKCNGIFGGFIKDPKKLSFIFSPHQNEFCKLKTFEKAIGVSYTQGPIIGDGDLAISDGAIHNICRFPASYEPSGKLKKLLKADKFEVEEYDLYQLWF